MVDKKISSELVYRSADTLSVLSIVLLAYFYPKTYDLNPYLVAGLGAALLFGFVGRFTEIYASWGGRPFMRDEGMRLVVTWLATFLLLIFIIFATKKSNEFSRLILISWLFITPIALISSRYILRGLQSALKTLGLNNRSIAIAGVTRQSLRFAQTVDSHPEMGLQIAGFYTVTDQESSHIPSQYAHIGNLETMLEAARNGTWDQIYLSLPAGWSPLDNDIINRLADTMTPIRLIPDEFTKTILSSRPMEMMNTPLVRLYDEPLTGLSALIKRAEDIVVSLIILALIAPLLIMIAIAVKVSSPGPILFKQSRHGLRGEKFQVWKFRSMTVCENGASIKQATRNDVRITKVGAFLRRTSLDELPQFFNVLQGHMSIVGPRPHAVAHNEQYKQLIPGYMSRHAMKPGITGWAQVNGWRGETDTLYKMQKRVEYDLEYIQRWSLWLDLKIIFATAFKTLNDKNAY